MDACSEETQQRSHRQLLEDLILHVFAGRPDLQEEIKAKYDKPPEVNHEEFEIDEEMQQLLMELAVTDQVNSEDLKSWKSDCDKKIIAKMNMQKKQAMDLKKRRSAEIRRREIRQRAR